MTENNPVTRAIRMNVNTSNRDDDDVLTFLNSRFPLLDRIAPCSASSSSQCPWSKLGRNFLHLVALRDDDDDDHHHQEQQGTVEATSSQRQPVRWSILVVRVENSSNDCAVPSSAAVTLQRIMQAACSVKSAGCSCISASDKCLLVFEDGGGFCLRELLLF